LLLLALLLASAARAQSSSSGPEAGPPAAESSAVAPESETSATVESEEVLTVILLPLESNAEAREQASGVTALLASRLAESPRLAVSTASDQEAIRIAGVCAVGPCPEAVPGTPGSRRARYVITGRLDGFGSRYLLTTSLVDSESGRALSRPRIEVSARDALPRAAVSVADQLLATFIPEPTERAVSKAPAVSKVPGVGSFLLGVRFNNSLISNFSSFNPGGDVEFGFQFHPEWVVFGQVGLSYVTGEEEGRKGGLNVLPSVLGLRHYHNVERSLRPYWGLGLGVQLSFGEFGIFRQTGPLPTVIGFAGFEYLIAGHLGLQLEASTNIAQATLGLSDGGLGSGLNLELNAGIAWHF
jgi:TolB-like protein